MAKIVVAGSINMDLVITSPRMPKLGETLTGSGFEIICGGKGANQAVAASRLGGNVTMIGAVGNDVYGKVLKDNLTNNSINADCVKELESSSGIAMIAICNGDNFIILEKGANALVTPEYIDACEDAIKDADYVIMQFEIPQESVLHTAKIAKKYGAKVVLNPAPMQEIDPEILKNTDILVTNETETAELLGYEVSDRESCIKAINDIRKMGISQSIITLGGDGCILNDGDEIITHGTYKVDVVDTTAAGDTFIGAYVCALADGKSVKDAVTFATKASNITVTKKGAATSIPTKAMVENTVFIEK